MSVAHQLMRRYTVRHLPVLDRRKVVGVVSQRDLYFLETIHVVDPETDLVDEAMSRDVYCVPPSARIAQVVSKMAEEKYGCAVVIERGKVVGMFTTTDALRVLARLLKKAR
jgi:acetoin utilization protein AcuB